MYSISVIKSYNNSFIIIILKMIILYFDKTPYCFSIKNTKCIQVASRNNN